MSEGRLPAFDESTETETQRAIREEWCNGCYQPRKRWGPVCPGMQLGDYTHYHSVDFWLYRETRGDD